MLHGAAPHNNMGAQLYHWFLPLRDIYYARLLLWDILTWCATPWETRPSTWMPINYYLSKAKNISNIVRHDLHLTHTSYHQQPSHLSPKLSVFTLPPPPPPLPLPSLAPPSPPTTTKTLHHHQPQQPTTPTLPPSSTTITTSKTLTLPQIQTTMTGNNSNNKEDTIHSHTQPKVHVLFYTLYFKLSRKSCYCPWNYVILLC